MHEYLIGFVMGVCFISLICNLWGNHTKMYKDGYDVGKKAKEGV